MTPNEFYLLTEEEKMMAIAHGEFISQLEAGPFTILLYRLKSFYLKMYFDSQTQHLLAYKPGRTVRSTTVYFKPSVN